MLIDLAALTKFGNDWKRNYCNEHKLRFVIFIFLSLSERLRGVKDYLTIGNYHYCSSIQNFSLCFGRKFDRYLGSWSF